MDLRLWNECWNSVWVGSAAVDLAQVPSGLSAQSSYLLWLQGTWGQILVLKSSTPPWSQAQWAVAGLTIAEQG